MRRLLFLASLLVSVVLFGVSATAAQGVRYANPPVTQVDLTGYEPLPPGIPTDVFYGGLGGGGGLTELYPPGLYWSSTPGAVATSQGAYFAACGYISSAPPTATLTLPSGAQTQLALDSYEDVTNCFDTRIQWAYGMELGIYTLALAHPEGTLTHTFGFDYPFCWSKITTPDGIDWIMGLEPNEQISLVFYAATASNDYQTQFVGVRNVRADENGAVALVLQVARSAPFSQNDLFYAVIGVGRLYYDMDPAFGGDLFGPQGFSELSVQQPQPTQPQTQVVFQRFGESDARGRSCDGEFSRFAQVFPFPNGVGSMPIYNAINDPSAIASLPAGTVVEILQTMPAVTSGRVQAWKYLRTEDGRMGWTPSRDMVDLSVTLQPGVRAEALPVGVPEPGTGILRPGPHPLYDSPNGRVIAQLQQEMQFTLLESQDMNYVTWWHIRLDGGGDGWIYDLDPNNFSGGIQGFPWTISPSSGGSNQSGGVTTSDRVCPNSPPPRLIPGHIGRVTPGDPNRIRVEPESGRVLGQIPAGGTFTVLGGPSCGPVNGLTWWQVDYNGTVGWTAEGQGNVYWLELVN